MMGLERKSLRALSGWSSPGELLRCHRQETDRTRSVVYQWIWRVAAEKPVRSLLQSSRQDMVVTKGMERSGWRASKAI